MKELTRQEFEQQIERVIRGEISRKKLAKELETDIRTINNKIMELSTENPDLYSKFVEKYPYKPKEIKVDIEKIAIMVIRYGIQKTAENVGISERTISRKVKKLEKTNPELYKIYSERGKKLTKEEQREVDEKLEEFIARYELKNSIPKRNEMNERKKELEETLSKFENLVKDGMSQAGAARALGFDDYPTIWKKYKELERIVLEENILNNPDEPKKSSEAKKYRDRMRVEGVDISKAIQANAGDKSEEKQQNNNGKESKKKIKTEQEER